MIITHPLLKDPMYIDVEMINGQTYVTNKKFMIYGRGDSLESAVDDMVSSVTKMNDGIQKQVLI